MGFFDSLLNQSITYWPPGTTDVYGKTTFSSPISIKGRWEDKSELFIDFSGQEIRSRSVVHVDRDLQLGGYLFLGDSQAADPTTLQNAYEIRAINKIPSVSGDEFNIQAVL